MCLQLCLQCYVRVSKIVLWAYELVSVSASESVSNTRTLLFDDGNGFHHLQQATERCSGTSTLLKLSLKFHKSSETSQQYLQSVARCSES